MAPKKLNTIDPHSAAALRERGAVFVDIREPGEHAAEHIPGDVLLPLSGLGSAKPIEGDNVVFYCRSGARTNMAAPQLAGLIKGEGFILAGGLGMWKTHGLPVESGGNGAQSGSFSLGNIFTRLTGRS